MAPRYLTELNWGIDEPISVRKVDGGWRYMENSTNFVLAVFSLSLTH